MKIDYLFKIIKNQLRHLSGKNKASSGFTLVELLTTTIIASLVISSLLWLMNDMIGANRREISTSQTQEQMKMALDYIAEDLRQSVYVYDGEGLAQLISQGAFGFESGTDKPILAFWKVEGVPYNSTQSLPSNCSTLSTDALKDECNRLKVERHSYTLVIYLQSTQNPDSASNKWDGKSRIVRYQLRKYNESNLSTTLAKNTGYVDPRSESSFDNWPEDDEGNSLQGTATATGATNALVDFVDFTDENTSNPGVLPTCVTDPSTTKEYFPSPSYTSAQDAKYSRGFYTCVRPALINANGAIGGNQDIVVYVRGNVQGQSGISSSDSYLPRLQIQVNSRGLIDKLAPD
jgi:type II secretory pathway pseudopilin PulG